MQIGSKEHLIAAPHHHCAQTSLRARMRLSKACALLAVAAVYPLPLLLLTLPLGRQLTSWVEVDAVTAAVDSTLAAAAPLAPYACAYLLAWRLACAWHEKE